MYSIMSDILELDDNIVLSPELETFTPKKKEKLKQSAKSHDMTLYNCPIMKAKMTIAGCARMQLAGRLECSLCKKPITEVWNETRAVSERGS